MKLVKLLAVVVGVGLAAFLVHAIREAKEAAAASSCEGRLNWLQAALRQYEAANGHLPPAYVLGPDGKPWHSWRVLLLPYLEEGEVYAKYRFDEPWNGPNNSRLADQIDVNAFQCPSGRDYDKTLNTNYLAVVGEGTAFPGDKPARLADFRDGLENTLLLAEVADAGIHWMEPRDLRLESIAVGRSTADVPAISSPHWRDPIVVFADRITAYRLSQPLGSASLHALATIAGGETTTRAALLAPDGGSRLSEKWDGGSK